MSGEIVVSKVFHLQLRRPQSFAVAFLIQKAGEFVLLSLCLALTAYFVGRTPEGVGWFPPQPSLALALRVGFQTTVLFFLFTLYPVVTLLAVWTYRRLLGVSVPIASALVSFAYVLLWLSLMPRGIGYTHPGFWTVTAIMVVFIWASAVVLYPPKRAQTPPQVPAGG
jgi:hypothetical protein